MTNNKKTDLLNDYHLLCYDELDSTNEEAKRLARGGGAHGAFIWSKRQTNGKGRYGREWVSEEGNLFVTILLSPKGERENFPELSFVAGLATLEAIAPLLTEDREVCCKWPNDILVNGRKLAGVLLESFEHEGKPWVAVGIGVNVESFPAEVMYPATSLKQEGVEIVSAKIVLSRLIHHFVECYNNWEGKGFAPIRRSWMKHAFALGQKIRVKLPDEEAEGIFKEIDGEGALVLQLAPRKKRMVRAGDVFASETVEEAVS